MICNGICWIGWGIKFWMMGLFMLGFGGLKIYVLWWEFLGFWVIVELLWEWELDEGVFICCVLDVWWVWCEELVLGWKIIFGVGVFLRFWEVWFDVGVLVIGCFLFGVFLFLEFFLLFFFFVIKFFNVCVSSDFFLVVVNLRIFGGGGFLLWIFLILKVVRFL